MKSAWIRPWRASGARAAQGSRRRAGLWAALGCLLAASTALGMQAGTEQAPGAAALPPRVEEAEPRPLCWAGYLAFENMHGLDGVREAIRRSIAQNDLDALEFLRERLTELIGTDAALAAQVIAWAEKAEEPELSLYLRAVREAEAVQTPAVSGQLLDMAERHVDPQHQAQALMALETQRRLEPAALDRLSELAWRSPVAGVAMHAVRTMGRVMETDYRAGGELTPYMARLLDMAEGVNEPDVRRLAVEMGTYPDPRFEHEELDRMAKILRGDPDADVREMAALVMSSAENVDAVLAHYRAAFPAEPELCVRWAIFRYSVRAGGPKALPMLKELAGLDPRFEQDYRDFEALYAEGLVDFERVWLRKQIRHTCEAEE